MALVFGLRLFVLSLVFLAVTGALFVYGLSRYQDFEAVAVIYSVYQLMVSLVLILIRFHYKISRVMILTPLLALLFPGWKFQLFGVLIAGCIALEGFRLEASLHESGRCFFVCQTLIMLAAITFLMYPNLLAVGVLGTLLYLGLGTACWRWQNAIKSAMKSLD